jgi:hypothetical protein
MAFGLRRELRLWQAMGLSPGDHGSDQHGGAERCVIDPAGRSGRSVGVGTAHEFVRILTSTPARELASDDVLRLENIAQLARRYRAVEMRPDRVFVRAKPMAPPRMAATVAKIP